MKVWEKVKKELTFETLFDLLFQDTNSIVVENLCSEYINEEGNCIKPCDCRTCIKEWLESDCK